MSDVAAVLAAALIQTNPKLTNNPMKSPAENAVKVYFDCVDALQEANNKRHTSSREELKL